MIQMSASQLNKLFSQHEPLAVEFTFKGVEIDSRNPCEGVLFVAIKGDNFDGHDYVLAAEEKGAVAVVVDREVDVSIPQIVVEDTRSALGQLARAWRRQMNPRVIAITGSNGKTTVKEMLGRILSDQHRTLVTEGNLNNDIGVPLTLFRLTHKERFAVLEMGANHKKEIKNLLSIAEPDIVYVNNARAAHVEGFGSLQGVIEAKGEMYQYCKPKALAVFNDDEDAAGFWRSISATQNQLRFSIQHQADITGSWSEQRQGIGLKIEYAQRQVDCQLNLYGSHNAQNALAAITLSIACGLSLEQAAASLQGFEGVAGRQQFLEGINHSRLINDSYNANPDSLSAALKVLCGQQGTPWLALGDMAELGEQAQSFHDQAAIEAKDAGVEKFFALGEMSCQAATVFGDSGHCFNTHDEMAAYIAQRITSNVVLLIKGSRSAAMEKLVEQLSHKSVSDRQPGVSHVV